MYEDHGVALNVKIGGCGVNSCGDREVGDGHIMEDLESKGG